MAQFEAVCDWCQKTVPSGTEIAIERSEGTEDEFSWEAFFCSNDHASLWVASPVEPIPQTTGAMTWGERALDTVLPVILMAILVLFSIGAVVSARWVLGLIF
jgi:hypothetical protein